MPRPVDRRRTFYDFFNNLGPAKLAVLMVPLGFVESHMEATQPQRHAGEVFGLIREAPIRFQIRGHVYSAQHQRREPAATEQQIHVELNGWLPSAECC